MRVRRGKGTPQQRTAELLAAGVSATCTDVNGHTPLHKAAFLGFDGVAALLIEHDPACVHARDLISNAPLHAAAFSGHAQVCFGLLAARAEVEVVDRLGNTPLHRIILNASLSEDCRLA